MATVKTNQQPASANGGHRTPVQNKNQKEQQKQAKNGAEEQTGEEHFSYIKRVGSYLVGRTLGEGSFAKVRLGLHLPTAEKVAIKVLDKHRAANDNYMEMTIRREGRLLRRIRPHPNIVQLYEVMETANSLYLVLELCEGGDFLDYVASRGRLSEQECRMFLRQIVDAVSHLHSFGILHRDLKIENFMLDSTMQNIKIIDLGLSTAAPGGSASRTQCGSPAYAAPELIRSPHYGPEVDVWSIGVDMFAMLTGGLPFTVEPFSIKNLYAKMMAREMNPLPSDTTPEAIDLLNRLLEPDPRLRISLQAATQHPWLRSSRRYRYSISEAPNSKNVFPQPNSIKIVTSQNKESPSADPSILDLSIATRAAALAGVSLGSLLRDVAAAVPSNLAATYHLLARHAKRNSSGNEDDESVSSEEAQQRVIRAALSSESASAIHQHQQQQQNQCHHHHHPQQHFQDPNIVRSHIPHVPRQYEVNKEMEVSFIAPSPKHAGHQLANINNMTKVIIAPHSLHRPVKVLPAHGVTVTSTKPQKPAVNLHHSESDPSGTQTLERRRLQKPRLAAPLNVPLPSPPDSEKKSASNVASPTERQQQVDLANDESVQTARYLGKADQPSALENGDVANRWVGDSIAGQIPVNLMTSCCGELPLKPYTPTSATLRAPNSTPTPPSCMQMSQLATKNEYAQSPRAVATTLTAKPLEFQQQPTKQDAVSIRKQSAIAMFGCVGRQQNRRMSINISDLSSKKQSYTPDIGYCTSSDAEASQYLNRLITSKTPPPYSSQINNNNNQQQQQNGATVTYHSTTAALIVKPAVQAISNAARRVLCGASPQPNNHSYHPQHHHASHHNTLDRSFARSKQAAV